MAKIRKPFYSNGDHTTIDVEYKHEDLGWIPMTITVKDYPELWAEAMKLSPSVNKEFVDQQLLSDAAARRAILSTSRAALSLKLRKLDVFSQEEAIQAARGEFPKKLGDIIAKHEPKLSLEDAEILWAGMTTIDRTDPISEALRKHLNQTPVQMDELFS